MKSKIIIIGLLLLCFLLVAAVGTEQTKIVDNKVLAVANPYSKDSSGFMRIDYLSMLINNNDLIEPYTIYEVCKPKEDIKNDFDLFFNENTDKYSVKYYMGFDIEATIKRDSYKKQFINNSGLKTFDNGTSYMKDEYYQDIYEGVKDFKVYPRIWGEFSKEDIRDYMNRLEVGDCFYLKVQGKRTTKDFLKEPFLVDNIVKYDDKYFTEYAWWNVSCSFKSSLSILPYITNSNQAIKINLTQADITSNKEKLFFYDVDATKTLRWFNETTEIVWVNTTFTGGTTKTIDIYGGSCGELPSQPASVFLEAFGFNSNAAEVQPFGTATNTTGGSQYSTALPVIEGTGYMNVSGQVDKRQKLVAVSDMVNKSFIFWAKNLSHGSNYLIIGLRNVTTSRDFSYIAMHDSTSTNWTYYFYDAGSHDTGYQPLPQLIEQGWHRWKVSQNDTGMNYYYDLGEGLRIQYPVTPDELNSIAIIQDDTTWGSLDLLFIYHDYGKDAPVITYSGTTTNAVIQYSNDTYNSTLYATELNPISVVAEYNASAGSISSAYLKYNNTIYATTVTAVTSNLSRITAYVTPNKDVGTNTFLFNTTFSYNNGSTEYIGSSQKSQVINQINMTYCGMTQQPWINYSFVDEATNKQVKAYITSASFYYTLNPSITSNLSLSYSNATESNQYAFCFNPTKNYTLYYDISYENTYYPNRNAISTINVNANKQIILYVINSTSSTYITFQVLNIAEQPLKNVLVAVNYSGVTIDSGYTDDSGSIMFPMNVLNTYDISFTKSGYITGKYTITPSQTSYTITLDSSTPVANNTNNYYQGIGITVSPNIINPLQNNTNYNFSFIISSSYWAMTQSGFILIGSNSSSNNSLATLTCTNNVLCDMSQVVNTGMYTSISMNYWWVVQGNYSNSTFTWNVVTSQLNESSMGYLITDLQKLSGGLNNFTKGIISILIIILAVGSLSYGTGIYSPLALAIYTFGTVGFLDLVGLLPTPLGASSHIITILTGLLVVIFAGYEVLQR